MTIGCRSVPRSASASLAERPMPFTGCLRPSFSEELLEAARSRRVDRVRRGAEGSGCAVRALPPASARSGHELHDDAEHPSVALLRTRTSSMNPPRQRLE